MKNMKKLKLKNNIAICRAYLHALHGETYLSFFRVFRAFRGEKGFLCGFVSLWLFKVPEKPVKFKINQFVNQPGTL